MFVHPESRGKILLHNIGRIRILGENYRFPVVFWKQVKDIEAIAL
jgi:hypothetical protein